MNINVIDNTQNLECDLLVVNQFEGEKTTNKFANKYAIEEDKFEGKFGNTYVLPTYGQEKYRKVLVIGFGKKEEFTPNKLREAIAKAVKKAMSIEAKTVAFKLEGVEFDYSEQFTMGTKIADYKFDKYKSEKKDKGLKEIFSPEEYEMLGADRRELIKEIQLRILDIKRLVREMTEARKIANHLGSQVEKAFSYEERVSPYLHEIREHIDHLELEIDDEIWPLPKYRELLFTK